MYPNGTQVKEVKMSNEFTDKWWDDFQDLHANLEEIMQDEKAHKLRGDALIFESSMTRIRR